ncbi:hypothetical protein MPER_09784 [Moniliophthora perniciosa FA553]|nr:hypothetical protein MPER_09784 [Moniliophthora perniciosa FA553]
MSAQTQTISRAQSLNLSRQQQEQQQRAASAQGMNMEGGRTLGEDVTNEPEDAGEIPEQDQRSESQIEGNEQGEPSGFTDLGGDFTDEQIQDRQRRLSRGRRQADRCTRPILEEDQLREYDRPRDAALDEEDFTPHLPATGFISTTYSLT